MQEPRCVAASTWEPRTEAYWSELLEDSMQVELPDAFLTNLIRASQVHCLLAARSEAAGRRVAPWISSDRYGPLESEANAVIRGMDLVGQTEFARRSLEFFITRYDPRGFLTTGYTLVGTGEHLWTLAEHSRADARSRLDQADRAGSGAGLRLDRRPAGEDQAARLPAVAEFPSTASMPPGVTADWNRFAYRFFNDAQYCAGLDSGGPGPGRVRTSRSRCAGGGGPPVSK